MRGLSSRRFLQRLAKGARRSRKPETAQALPQVLAADADGAGSPAHLPVVLGQLLQQVLPFAFFQAILQRWLVHADAVNADTTVSTRLFFIEQYLRVERIAGCQHIGTLDAVAQFA